MKRFSWMLAVLVLGHAGELLAAEGGMAGTGLRAAFSLLLVIALMFGIAWVIKRYGPVARARKTFGLDVLGQVSVGSKATLALVRVGTSVLLLGVTANTVNLLKDIEQGDFEKSLSEFAEPVGSHQ
ncbi:MAG TPA: flagellar biosynthetic protein FliO [Deltaproteobacteria bacterium]|nr:flagellar biosynthetic protein FliO [Deltaproteobacteria bacterium]OQC28462.1 MAG: Flagellar protein FliO [Deltaproteobacteria bacterium ADurb.Bin072]HRW79771.1 flagellar biosynthetic protein FliO [Desulfomonilia bacterium]NMD40707.1 flagellar biosynthetic protein FliO [Deltaproteobacteria bacterium]HNQ85540.1 flagellar biosynthetic protein FliO [Deltaproteobacteria bacterium]